MPVPTPTAPRDAVLSSVGDPRASALDIEAWLQILGRPGDRLTSAARTRLATGAGRARTAGIPLTTVVEAWLAAADATAAARTPAAHVGLIGDGTRALCAGFADGQVEELRRAERRRLLVLDALLSERPAEEVLELAAEAEVDLGGRRAVLVVGAVTDAVLERLQDAGALAAPRDGAVVAVLAGRTPRGPEPAGLGRPGLGVAGVRTSHAEALRALEVAQRMGLRGIVPYGDVLPEALIGQDRATLAELVESTLSPLQSSRSGGPQYVETAAVWLQEGLSVAAAARVLDVNERTVRYRLARIAKLTGLDLQHADDRFRLELAIRGARLLDEGR